MATVQTLSDRMEFDHVIQVTESGDVLDADALYAPSLLDGELDTEGWTLLNGYSGQYGYSGPILHPSEFIGGGLERDILARPGFYVALVSSVSPEGEEDDLDVDGWAVAYREAP